MEEKVQRISFQFCDTGAALRCLCFRLLYLQMRQYKLIVATIRWYGLSFFVRLSKLSHFHRLPLNGERIAESRQSDSIYVL